MEVSSSPLMIRLLEWIVFWPPFCIFLIDRVFRLIGIEIIDPTVQTALTILVGLLGGAVLGRLVRWRVFT
jgi:hypothetical protein